MHTDSADPYFVEWGSATRDYSNEKFLFQYYRNVYFLFAIDYVNELFTELCSVLQNPNQYQPTSIVPSFLCSNFDRPDKVDAINQHSTRFLKDNWNNTYLWKIIETIPIYYWRRNKKYDNQWFYNSGYLNPV